MAKILGLDLGVSSIGWCLYEADPVILTDKYGEVITENGEVVTHSYTPKHIVDLGSFIFSEIEDGKTGKTANVVRRTKRLMRRQRRRSVRRLSYLRSLFQEYFHVDFLKDVIEKRQKQSLSKEEQSPFNLKVKGLNEKLTADELMVVLYHYLKHRGFQSNRKAANEKDENNKKILGAISETKKHLKDGLYVTEYLLKNVSERTAIDAGNNQIRNSGDNFVMAVTRAMYLEEINYLLDKQISFGLINDDFKNKYLEIYKRQRTYSEGPASGPFKVDFDKIIGTCKFDNLPRAAKDSISAKRFVLLSALNNLRYRFKGEYKYNRRLTPEEIVKLEEAFISKKEVKYKDIVSRLGKSKDEKENIEFQNLNLSHKQFRKIVSKYREENNLKEEEIIPGDVLENLVRDKQLETIFFKGSNLIKCIHEELDVDDDKTIDAIAEILLRNKDDSRIREAMKKADLSDKLIDGLLDINVDAKITIDLSVDLCKKLLPELRKGLDYVTAMRKLGYVSKAIDKPEVLGEIPPIDEALAKMQITLRNPVVKHTLVQLRKIINAIHKTYGNIDECTIELSRELKKSFTERKAIRDSQKENQEYNYDLRAEIIEKGFRKGFQYVTYDDLLRYKLYKEQSGFSPYTNQPINERDIFDNNARAYEIDHIMPYSRSFDDSFNNKVLVETRMNQEKGNRLPSEVSGVKGEALMESIKAFLSKKTYFNAKKRDNLLRKEIPEDFKNSNLTDTSYLSKLARDLISFYVLPEGKPCRTTSGGVTALLRTKWNLSGKTHTYNVCGDGSKVSYENKLYQAKFGADYEYVDVELTDKKDAQTIKFIFNVKSLVGGKIVLISKPFELKYKKPKEADGNKQKEAKALSMQEQRLNEAICDFIVSYHDCFEQKFNNAKGKTIDDLISQIEGKHQNNETYSTEAYEKHLGNCMYLLGKVRADIQTDINAKDRSNDLHHALDAAVIAVSNPSLVMRIAKANRDKEAWKDLASQDIKCPLPYEGFREELLARVYERDADKLLNVLNDLPLYKNNPLSKYDVHVLIPVHQPDTHKEGAISGETIYGSGMYFVDGNKKFVARKKISIVLKGDKDFSKKKIDKDDIESIVDKDNGNKAVYEALRDWINSSMGEYPRLRNGHVIKSFKIYGPNPNKVIALSNKPDRLVENSEVIQTKIFRKKEGNQDNLFFVPIYYYQIFESKKPNNRKNITYTLMWKQGADGSIQISGDELKSNYVLIGTLPRFSLIEIELNNGVNCLVYSAGVSSGMFEIYSLLGDCGDIKQILGKKQKKQIQITCSTIKNIKVRSISVLGKVS